MVVIVFEYIKMHIDELNSIFYFNFLLLMWKFEIYSELNYEKM